MLSRKGKRYRTRHSVTIGKKRMIETVKETGFAAQASRKRPPDQVLRECGITDDRGNVLVRYSSLCAETEYFCGGEIFVFIIRTRSLQRLQQVMRWHWLKLSESGDVRLDDIRPGLPGRALTVSTRTDRHGKTVADTIAITVLQGDEEAIRFIRHASWCLKGEIVYLAPTGNGGMSYRRAHDASKYNGKRPDNPVPVPLIK